MKKSIIPILCVAFIVLVPFSCKKSVQVDMKEYSLDKKYYLTEDTTKGVLSVNMQVELPVKYKNKEVLKMIHDNIVGSLFGDKFLSIPNDSLLIAFASQLNAEYQVNYYPFLNGENLSDEVGAIFSNDFNLKSSSMLNDGKILAYMSDLYVYMGGAHGLRTILYYNFDMETGNLISEDDVFVDGSEPALTYLIKKHIVEDSDEINSMEDLGEIYWTEDIKPNGNFAIAQDGIVYVFNPYEIAPYVYGRTHVNLPYKEIRDIIKPDSPVSYLIKEK